MIYRKFGNTGENISALGFGCMRLPEIEENGVWTVDYDKSTEMLRHAYDLGVNYFDTAYYYCHENSEIAVGKALKPIRDKVLISTKCPLENVKVKEDYRKMLEKSLAKLDTDYIDFYHFWAINRKVFDEKIMGLGLIEEALKLKAEGKIRHISFSFHDDPIHIKHIIDTAPELETMLVQYNLIDRSNEEMIAYAASKGLGVLAMGPVGGGRLAAPTELYKKLTGKESIATYELAFRFVLGNPNISCALSGMENIEMVDKNVAVASLEEPMSEKKWSELTTAIENVKKFSELYCTGCGYCQPCPKGIEIPKLFGAYTYHNVYGLNELAKKEFTAYCEGTDDKKGALSSECINCGYCERKCPQKLKIRDLLKKVESALSQL
ncbi:aldo/keto reductase [Paludicola sp. MB14-C6]|uniref:aldo/keto reductase n=1 Tax=Paludihabitans sp. MB14-C6 TaxID=3070656 RepID=UPI0027DE1DA9|nr:aldo/keto reductase [Paludicola sp. MB14-C6]WMJ22265.1 aldo/keto reductase [Paludicola sp. MB14-C6]